MPAKFDVAAKDLRNYAKGDIVSIMPEGQECSNDPTNFV